MGLALLGLVIRFLHRLVLFPWLTLQVLAYTMASQVNWLVTGMTFEEVQRREKKLTSFQRM